MTYKTNDLLLASGRTTPGQIFASRNNTKRTAPGRDHPLDFFQTTTRDTPHSMYGYLHSPLFSHPWPEAGQSASPMERLGRLSKRVQTSPRGESSRARPGAESLKRLAVRLPGPSGGLPGRTCEQTPQTRCVGFDLVTQEEVPPNLASFSAGILRLGQLRSVPALLGASFSPKKPAESHDLLVGLGFLRCLNNDLETVQHRSSLRILKYH